MTKAPPIDRFRRGEVVKALDRLPGVPQGTRGRIYLIDGFTWTRYRVLFDNGVDIGSLDGSVLARPKQYNEALKRRAAAEAAAADGAEAADAAPSAAEGETPLASGDAEKSASGGEGRSAGGKKIPAHLLERSKRARDKSGGGGGAASASSDGGQAETPSASEGERTAAASAGDATPSAGETAADGGSSGGEGSGSGDEPKAAGGKKIPAHLLERSKRARQQAN